MFTSVKIGTYIGHGLRFAYVSRGGKYLLTTFSTNLNIKASIDFAPQLFVREVSYHYPVLSPD
jgi:hypothetical protein